MGGNFFSCIKIWMRTMQEQPKVEKMLEGDAHAGESVTSRDDPGYFTFSVTWKVWMVWKKKKAQEKPSETKHTPRRFGCDRRPSGGRGVPPRMLARPPNPWPQHASQSWRFPPKRFTVVLPRPNSVSTLRSNYLYLVFSRPWFYLKK